MDNGQDNGSRRIVVQDDGLKRIVLKLMKDDPELRIENLNNIHPMIEALIALVRQQLTDPEIGTCFSQCEGKDGLKSVLVLDALLEEYKKSPEYSNNLKQSLLSGKSISEVIQTASLYISENRRIKDGNVIQRVGDSSDKHLLKAVKYLEPSEVYVKATDIPVLREKYKNMKRNWIRGLLVVSLGLTALLGYTAYNMQRARYSENMLKQMMIEKKSLQNNDDASNLDGLIYKKDGGYTR